MSNSDKPIDYPALLAEAQRHLGYFTQQCDYMHGRKAHWEDEIRRLLHDYALARGVEPEDKDDPVTKKWATRAKIYPSGLDTTVTTFPELVEGVTDKETRDQLGSDYAMTYYREKGIVT